MAAPEDEPSPTTGSGSVPPSADHPIAVTPPPGPAGPAPASSPPLPESARTAASACPRPEAAPHTSDRPSVGRWSPRGSRGVSSYAPVQPAHRVRLDPLLQRPPGYSQDRKS